MKTYRFHYYNGKKDDIVDTNLDDFFKELFLLYEKYDISISHEDENGAFLLECYYPNNVKWIEEADACEWLGLVDDNGQKIGYAESIENSLY